MYKISNTQKGILAIIGLVALWNLISLGSVALGQEMTTETQKLSALLTELSAYGYTEVADLTYDGSLVEFRSNGTITLHEDTAGEIISKYGFTMKEFAPAPALEEDSIIIVDMNRTADYTGGVVL
jgi:hypothetical protein